MGQALAIRRSGQCDASTRTHPLAEALAPLFQPHFHGLAHELLIIAGFDACQRLLSFVEQPGQSRSIASVLPALRRALAPERVSLLLVAHNHPCGSLAPSQADCQVTRRIAALARLADVTLVDHLIFVGTRTTSFRALGLL